MNEKLELKTIDDSKAEIAKELRDILHNLDMSKEDSKLTMDQNTEKSIND